MKTYIYSFLLVILLTSCNEASTEEPSVDKMVSLSLPPKEKNYSVAEVDSVATTEDFEDSNKPTSEADKIEPQIIKNGDLRFETNDLAKTFENIQIAVKKNGGNIQNDNEGKDYQTHFRYLTVRIPSKNFDLFIKEISTGVNYFDKKEISSDDVTEEYIDVASRIKTKKALEQRYLELLKKATKVSEMLEVERQLSDIREEIESKEGRLKYIKNRVSMSTITLEIYKTVAEKSGATVSFGSKFVNAIKSGFNGISSFFIWLIGIWPFIIILVAIIYFARKRFKKKTQKDV